MLKDKTRYHTALCFDDVLLAPRYSDIESRSEISCTTDICSRIALDLPIISSPMDTITGYCHGCINDSCRWRWNYSSL